MKKQVAIQHRKGQICPLAIQKRLLLLEADLRKYAGKPFNCGWKNFGALPQCGKNVYHCHLTPKYVVVWELIENSTGIICRITYAGTREKAPY